MIKNVVKFAAVVFAMVTVASCSSSESEEYTTGEIKEMSFTATSGEGSAAKKNISGRRYTHLVQPNNQVHFNSGDAISIFDGTSNNKFTTSQEGATAVFDGEAAELTEGKYTALYPYQASASFTSATTLTANLPATQTATEDTYDPQANLSVATTTLANRKFYFKNVCGLIKFTVNATWSKVVLKGNAGTEKMAGNLTITLGEDDISTTSTDDNISAITLTGKDGAPITAGTYYFVVRAQDFTNGLTLEGYAVGNNTAKASVAKKANFRINLQRAYILDFGILDYEHLDMGSDEIDWGTTNVGALEPYDPGDYFQWGETAPHATGVVYDWMHYDFILDNNKDGIIETDNNGFKNGDGVSKYNATDGLTVLQGVDDAATATRGGYWRMPTEEEWNELVTECTWTVTTLNGSDVMKVYNATTENTIYLPITGYYDVNNNANRFNESKNKKLMYYWSKEIGYKGGNAVWTNGSVEQIKFKEYKNDSGYKFENKSGDLAISSVYRYYGILIRPVYVKRQAPKVEGEGDKLTITAIGQEDVIIEMLPTWENH